MSVGVGVGVGTAVGVAVGAGVAVGLGVGVGAGTAVGTFVGTGEAVGSGEQAKTNAAPSNHAMTRQRPHHPPNVWMVRRLPTNANTTILNFP